MIIIPSEEGAHEIEIESGQNARTEIGTGIVIGTDTAATETELTVAGIGIEAGEVVAEKSTGLQDISTSEMETTTGKYYHQRFQSNQNTRFVTCGCNVRSKQ